jgi:tetratricopeptide (TPR) repeat protein
MGLNRLPEAIAVSRKAIGYYSANQADRRVPEAWVELAEELNKAGQYREALQWAEKTIGAKYPNPDEDDVLAAGLAESATALAHLGQRPEALQRLERALRMLEPHDMGTGELADVRFRLARLLWEDPAQRTRATELGQKAAEVYRRRHKQAALARVESWLAHPQKEH